jgi:multidrug efflux pump subunit AcrB
MMRLQHEIGEVLLKDPDVEAFQAQTGTLGIGGFAQTANTARFNIALKTRDQRSLTAAQIIDRLRPQTTRIKGGQSRAERCAGHHR